MWHEELHAAMSRFLTVELEVGLGFAQAAAEARWTEELLRNRRIARRAYELARQMIGRTYLSRPEMARLEKKLRELRAALLKLGDPFPVAPRKKRAR
jgi:hypothetical protein